MSIADETGPVGIDMAKAFPVATSLKVFADGARLVHRAEAAVAAGDGMMAVRLKSAAWEKVQRSHQIKNGYPADLPA